MQIVRLWPLGSLASGSREPGAKKSRPNTNCVRPALFGPFGPLRLDIDFLRPDIDILRPDIDILRPDINIMRPDINILTPKEPRPNQVPGGHKEPRPNKEPGGHKKPGGQSLTSQGAKA